MAVVLCVLGLPPFFFLFLIIPATIGVDRKKKKQSLAKFAAFSIRFNRNRCSRDKLKRVVFEFYQNLKFFFFFIVFIFGREKNLFFFLFLKIFQITKIVRKFVKFLKLDLSKVYSKWLEFCRMFNFIVVTKFRFLGFFGIGRSVG